MRRPPLNEVLPTAELAPGLGLRSMSRLAVVLAIVVASTAGVAGSSTGAVRTQRDARIVGAIHYKGGPHPFGPGKPAPPDARPGRVKVIDRHGRVVARRTVKQGQRYDFLLAPGRYRLVAHSGDAYCQPRKVRAPAGRTVTSNVDCGVK